MADAKLDVIRRFIRPLGLHYRANELIRLAKTLRKRHKGVVPTDLGALLSLPGVGDYAARAVLTFAYEKQVAMVDTNVARFLLRYFNLAGPKTQNPARSRDLLALARGLLPAGRARDFNLAILDLCAAHCLASAPLCVRCPLQSRCAFAASVHTAAVLAEAGEVETGAERVAAA